MPTESSRRAIAAVLKPWARSSSIPFSGQSLSSPPIQAQGIWKTVPMLTRMQRR